MDSVRTITKVKYAKGRVHITFQLKAAGMEEPDEYVLKCGEPPAPSFQKAFGALDVHAAEICEMPNPAAWAVGLEVRSVSFSWTSAIMGAVITVLKPMEKARSPMTVNTPHKSESPYSTGDPDAADFCLTAKCAGALRKLLKEADKYIDGKRAQMSLPLEGDAK